MKNRKVWVSLPARAWCSALSLLFVCSAAADEVGNVSSRGAVQEQGTASLAGIADAAERGEWTRIPQLLQSGCSVNAAQADGMTALHWAVMQNNLPQVSQLLQAGATVDAENSYGVRPLLLACEAGAGEIVERLLQSGAETSVRGAGGETLLMLAARAGHERAVLALLHAGVAPNGRDQKQQTALMWAAAEGHVVVVDRLLQGGADAAAATPAGWTAGLFAVREGRTEVLLRLLQAGMDVNAARTVGGQAKGPNPLLLAVQNGHFETAAAILGAGADPNAQPMGQGALHAVVAVRRPVRGDGDPPPVGSGRMSSLQFVRRLVQRGGDVNLRLRQGQSGFADFTTTGCTAFVLAAQTGDLALLELLLELKADPQIPNADGATAVQAAAGVGDLGSGLESAGSEAEAIQVVKRLQQLGLDLNAVDENGETAMHGAAYQNWPALIEYLDEQGLRPAVWNQPNRWGWTPLIIAHGYREGNFRPDAATIASLEQVMRRRGQAIPADPGKDVEANQQSWDRKVQSKGKQ